MHTPTADPAIGRALRERRVQLHLTLRALAARAAVPMRRIQRAEVAEHPLVGDALAATLSALDWTEADLTAAASTPPQAAPPQRLALPPEIAARVPAWVRDVDWRLDSQQIADQFGLSRQRVWAVRARLIALGYPVEAIRPHPAPKGARRMSAEAEVGA